MLKEGDTVPDVTIKQATNQGPVDVSLREYCAGRKIIIFALPGAFTRTCSDFHLPGYLDNAQALKDKGVSAIACLAPNDHYVMAAWGKKQVVGDLVDMFADGNLEFTRAAGMSLDLSAGGLGERTQRYAIVVDNGVITHLGLESSAGEATVSSAEAVLKAL